MSTESELGRWNYKKMKIKQVSEMKLLDEMRKQFSYSLFIFMLMVSLVVIVEKDVFEKLTTKHIAVVLIIYSFIQTSIYLTFLKQNRELKRRLK